MIIQLIWIYMDLDIRSLNWSLIYLDTCCEIPLRCIPLNCDNVKLRLAQIMACGLTAPSNYLCQYWPRYIQCSKLCALFILGNIEIYLYPLSFLNTETMQVLEILPCRLKSFSSENKDLKDLKWIRYMMSEIVSLTFPRIKIDIQGLNQCRPHD